MRPGHSDDYRQWLGARGAREPDAGRRASPGRAHAAPFVPTSRATSPARSSFGFGRRGSRFFLTASGRQSQARTSFTDSVTWLNETDLAAEADFAVLQFPTTFTNTGGPSPSIFGRLFETGVTEAAGPAPLVVAQIGYGPAGSDPRVTPWVWAPATFNAQVGNDDEYQAVLTLPPGTYSYTFRFSLDGGFSFTLADLDGAGANAGLTFSTAQLGTATACRR